MKILIVEDSLTQLKLLEKILQNNFELYLTEDAFDAYLKLNLHDDISVVMVDYHMPFVNGAEFIRKIKQTDRFADLPMILFTDKETEDMYQDVLSSGATTFLKKPFSAKNLNQILANYIKEEV